MNKTKHVNIPTQEYVSVKDVLYIIVSLVNHFFIT